MPIRILVVDDHAVVREGITYIINNTNEDLQVVWQAATGDEAIKLARLHRPDLVIMDIRMPGMTGIEATREIRSLLPEAKIVALTTFDDEEYLFGMLEAGAVSFLLKDMPPPELLNALRTIVTGGTVFSPGSAQKLVSKMKQLEVDRVERMPAKAAELELSKRDLQILQLLADGMDNNQIAQEIYLGEGTTKNYISRLYDKLGARNRAHAITVARQAGLVK